MKIKVNHFSKEEVLKARESESRTINGGFPTFNNCSITTIDMTEKEKDIHGSSMHTISIKIDNDGTYITLCIIPMHDGTYINTDVKMHTKNESREHRAIHFSKNSQEITRIKDLNLLALISEVKSNGNE